jgi:hypothetical protein
MTRRNLKILVLSELICIKHGFVTYDVDTKFFAYIIYDVHRFTTKLLNLLLRKLIIYFLCSSLLNSL